MSGWWIVDRFEGAMAVLEHSETLEHVDVLRAALPGGVRAGDCLRRDANGGWFADAAQTAERKARVRARFGRLRP